MVDSEDPERADRLRRRLSPQTGPPPAAGAETLEAMRQLLADLRREPAGAGASPGEEPPASTGEGAGPAARPLPERPEARPPERPLGSLVRLAVDDGGESLLARGTEFVLGHLRSERADLPFLADIEREHVRLFRVESFHGGTCWRLEANGAVEVDGRPVAEGDEGGRSVALGDGQEVRLAHNLAFRFRLPDPSSSSVALELLQGAECLGTSRVLLCVPGEGGRLRVGPGRDRHIGVGALEEDLRLRFDEGRLVLSCAVGLRSFVTVPGASADERELSLPWPLPVAVDLAVGRAGPDRPPFGVALRPVTEPRTHGEEGPA